MNIQLQKTRDHIADYVRYREFEYISWILFLQHVLCFFLKHVGNAGWIPSGAKDQSPWHRDCVVEEEGAKLAKIDTMGLVSILQCSLWIVHHFPMFRSVSLRLNFQFRSRFCQSKRVRS